MCFFIRQRLYIKQIKIIPSMRSSFNSKKGRSCITSDATEFFSSDKKSLHLKHITAVGFKKKTKSE